MTKTPDTAVRQHYDVVIVGFGPVGQTLSILLAQRGHRVAVVERHGEIYPKPRAVAFDDEVARVFAGAGIADRFPDLGPPTTGWEFVNADGELLVEFRYTELGSSGWPQSRFFTQPVLERVLAERAAALGVTVFRSSEAVQLTEHPDSVELLVRGAQLKQRRLAASYLVGCDGANSFVRQRMDSPVTDLGFFYDWLICDVIEHEPRTWSPQNTQVCDPARPTTLVQSGHGNRRRWEFMRMPGDVLEQFETEENAWRLLAPWGITPETATLERAVVYTFQARWVDGWQDGRLILAGDAAHLMPPFAAQGMCSGIRDAANLAWKLDLVLREVADPELLATYSSERTAHVQHAIMTSVELGKIICATDPEVVAGRDAHLLAVGPDPAAALPPIPPARLGRGALQSGADGLPVPPAGLPAVQGRVTTPGGRTGLLDEVYGTGFHVLLDGARLTGGPTAVAGADVLNLLGAVVVPLVPVGGDGVQDLDGVLLPHLQASGHGAQVVRPDGYVFGGVADPADLPTLLAELAAALHVVPAAAGSTGLVDAVGV